MRFVLALLAISAPLMTACQKASAASNDEMAQCIAAIGWAREFEIRHPPVRYELLPVLTAGVMYYTQKLRAAGVPDGGRADALAFLDKHMNDRRFMNETVKSCQKKQLNDPEFLEQFPKLADAALQVDPLCRPDPARCTRR
jgi:hypothetical protein